MLWYKEPNCVNEAIVQAELYYTCKNAGLKCDLEYIFSPDSGRKCVFDLVVIENYQVIAIVEVKRYDHFGYTFQLDADQIKRYQQLGVPVLTLYSIYDIPYLVKKLVSIQKRYLESIENTTSGERNESGKIGERVQKEDILTVFDTFDKTYPNYEFANERSLQNF